MDKVIHVDSDILGGTPVFCGTRVPVSNLSCKNPPRFHTWGIQNLKVKSEKLKNLNFNNLHFADRSLSSLSTSCPLRYRF